MNPEISVIIPVYNGQEYIVRCIRSIQKQTNIDIEIIIVDDGSTDNSVEIIKQMCLEDSRISFLCQENRGPSAARNIGLAVATGYYVSFVDCDDYISENAYEKMYSLAELHQAEIVMCDYMCVEQNNEQIVMRHILPDILQGNEQIVKKLLIQYYGGNMTGLPSLWNKLYKKDFIGNARFDESLYRGEDWWYNMHLFERATKIVTMHEPLYYYWQGNSHSIMKRLDKNYYVEWKTARLYLTKRNDELYGFPVDENRVYSQLLFNIHSLLIVMSKRGEDISDIIKDPFYKEIKKYDNNTSLIVRICHMLSGSEQLGKWVYRLLAKIY